MSELEQLDTPSAPSLGLSKAERARVAREELIGKTIAGGRYVLRSLLGHGGMGAVYEAEHVGIGKKVAIKFVDSEFVTDEQIVTRFAREARAMTAVESPHIVSIFDAGTEEGRPYLVMELLRGEDLGQRLRRTSRVPLAEALHITAMVLKGLSKAHAAGIVHRDLKPDNIFLVKNDADPIFAKIVDFGVSKIERPRNRTSPLALTGRGTVLGTPFYMSPEQAQAVPDLDGRADLFSVGTILFECLSGRPPFTGETYEQIILAICMRDAPELVTLDSDIPPRVSKYVAKALARDRNQRFSSADEMLAALHELSPEEKDLVPANTPVNMNRTLVAGGTGKSTPPSANANANVTAATPTSVKPFKPFSGGSTQPAGSADATAQATPVGMQQAMAIVGASAVPTSTPPTMPSPRGSTPSGVPQRRSSSAIIATAAVAALLGVAATFGIISIVAKDKPPLAVPSASASDLPAATVIPPSSNAARPSAEPVVSAPPSASTPPLPVVQPAVQPSPKPAPLPIATPKPKSSGKSLDISRDLP